MKLGENDVLALTAVAVAACPTANTLILLTYIEIMTIETIALLKNRLFKRAPPLNWLH